MKTETTDEKLLHDIALAIVRANPIAGSKGYWEEDCTETEEDRAANLLRVIGDQSSFGPYGPYVRLGDPHGWSHGAVATVYCEAYGTKDDCEVPFDYWAGGIDQQCNASDELAKLGHELYFECVNAAIVAVHRV